MKKILATLICLFSFVGMSYADVTVDFNKGAFGAEGSGKENVWTSDNGVLTLTLTAGVNAEYSVDYDNNAIICFENNKDKKSTLAFTFAISEDFEAIYGVASVQLFIENIGATTDASVSVNDKLVSKLDPGKNTTVTVPAATGGATVTMIVGKANNCENVHVRISCLIVTPKTMTDDPERELETGTTCKLYFPDADKYILTGADNDSIYVIGNTGETEIGKYRYMFASNSNESENHFLTNNGVDEPTYNSDNCGYRLLLGNNFNFALLNSNSNYLCWNFKDECLCSYATQVDNEDYTTEIRIIPVPYPYLDVTLSGDEYGTEGSFGTVYLPFPFTLPEGIEAYIGTTSRRTTNKEVDLGLTQVADNGGVLPGGAYLLHSATSDSYHLMPANTAPTANTSGNVFIGSTKNPGVTKGDTDLYNAELAGTNPYVLSKKMTTIATGAKRDVVIGFYPYIDVSYPKGKAIYTTTEKSSLVRFHMGDAEDEVEGIETVATSQNSKAYDLTGRCVTGAYKGLKIINGKKVY